jgi:membrane glycosyltransferase
MKHMNTPDLVDMPPTAPLASETQNFSKAYRDPNAPTVKQIQGTWMFRAWVFGPALVMTGALIAILFDWFREDGFGVAEIILVCFVAYTTFWIALSAASAIVGMFTPRITEHRPSSGDPSSMTTALLVPIYEEDPVITFKRIASMQKSLVARSTNHTYAFFILSDTRSKTTAAQEQAEFAKLKAQIDTRVDIFYRRRETNTDRKTGNLQDWINNWGGDWDAFITLDSDSLMSARTIHRLTDKLVTMPEVGLLQTVPRLLGGKTMFARGQQFSNNVYGGILAKGLERWSGVDGNYWGHNAIIRTEAFANCAHLPRLSGKGPLSGTIKSHDFIEAALLRRAGWSVRLLPELDESYEEIPQTLIDYILRDRRWCQGNLQHLRLLGSKGFTAFSRFHLFQGAMAYVSSFIWFALLIVWTVMGRNEEQNIVRYFTDANPLFPQWPHMDTVSRMAVLTTMLALLLVPKLLGIAATYLRNRSCEEYGGRARFLLSSLVEIIFSIALAPILMIQHVLAVLRTIVGKDAGWAPQNRSGGNYSLFALLRFHWLETTIGMLLTIGLVLGLVSLWLVPIAISLLMTIPISFATGIEISTRGFFSKVLTTRENWAPPRIVTMVHNSGHDLSLITSYKDTLANAEIPAAKASN